jgi:hypothetical protein
MPDRELLRRVGRQSKIALLAAEARTGELPSSDLTALLDLFAAGANERKALARAALELLVAEGVPAGRIADLNMAFGLTDTTRLAILPAEPEPPPKPDVTETRRVRLAFRAPFEADPAAPPEPGITPPSLEATPTAPPPRPAGTQVSPAIPRAPLPVRGAAATIFAKGAGAAGIATPVPPLAPPREPLPEPQPLPLPAPGAPAPKPRKELTDIVFGSNTRMLSLDLPAKPAEAAGPGPAPGAGPGPGAADGKRKPPRP